MCKANRKSKVIQVTAGIVDFIYDSRKGTQKVGLLDVKYRKKGQGRNNEFYLLRQNKITQNKTACFKTALQEPFRNRESSFGEKTKTIITDRSFFLGNFLGL